MKSINKDIVAKRIKDLREDKDLTQEDIARIFKIDQSNYSKYELGKLTLPQDLIIKFSVFYNVSTDYLLGLSNDVEYVSRVKDRVRITA